MTHDKPTRFHHRLSLFLMRYFALTIAIVFPTPFALSAFGVQSSHEAASIHTNSIGQELISVPEGFIIVPHLKNAAGFETDKNTKVIASIGEGLWVSTTEVSRGEFKQFAESTGYITDAEKAIAAGVNTNQHTWKKPGFDQTDSHPVVCVSFRDASAFCQWLTRTDGQYYRLPSASEMDYLIASELDLLASPTDLASIANFQDVSWFHRSGMETVRDFKFEEGWDTVDDSFPFTAPVGSFRHSSLGVFDCIGNVAEWTLDEGYLWSGESEDETEHNWRPGRIIKGECYRSSPSKCTQVGDKYINAERSYSRALGFRVVMIR